MPKKIVSQVSRDEYGSRSINRGGSGARIDAILATASRLFNSRGIGAVSLNEIAGQVGLTRAAIYYYVVDRDDLLFRCYSQTCDADAEILARAARQGRGLSQIQAYLRMSFDSGRQLTTAITDTSLLSQQSRATIQAAQTRNYNVILAMVRAGTADCSIRSCDEIIVAHALAGIVAYRPIASLSRDPDDPSDHIFDPDIVVDVITNGVASDRQSEPQCPVDISEFSRFNTVRIDQESRNTFRIEQILMTASRLFNQRGIHGVTVDEIADALGATRGAFYHYVKDKKHLVQLCAIRALELYDSFFDVAETRGRNGQEASSIVGHLNVQAQASGLCPLTPWIGIEMLTPAQRRKQLQGNRRSVERTIRLAEKGIADGTRRPLDLQSVAWLRPGAYFWIPQWLETLQGYTPRRLADEIMLLFHRGLGAP